MQVLHSSPELGGDAVQEPYEATPGMYVGTAHTSHVQPLLTMDLQALVHAVLNGHMYMGLCLSCTWPDVGIIAFLAQGSECKCL